MASGRASAFLERSWQVFDRAGANASAGPTAAFAIADKLRAHATMVQPSWPTASDREGDHAHHLRLIGILSRVDRQRR